MKIINKSKCPIGRMFSSLCCVVTFFLTKPGWILTLDIQQQFLKKWLENFLIQMKIMIDIYLQIYKINLCCKIQIPSAFYGRGAMFRLSVCIGIFNFIT